jgi:uncharacterized membrane protein YjgN (DUF898 family)
MENQIQEINNTQIEFKGKGSEYFGIWILNALLIGITLGFYYPWAKTKSRKFFTSNTYFSGSPFSYHGTGLELLKGFFVVIAFIALFYIAYFSVAASGNQEALIIFMIVFYALLLLLIPISIHGSLKYRTSRTSWRNIFFNYSGNRNELIILFLKNTFLTLITFGIYYSWAEVKMSKYIIEKLGLGNVKASFTGKGSELFFIHFVGFILIILTLGIYSFWYIKNLYEYYAKNMFLHQGENVISLNSSYTGGGIFKLEIVNFFLVIFTFGLAIPWAIIRSIDYMTKHISIDDTLNPNEIEQSVLENKANSIGDGMADALDLGF